MTQAGRRFALALTVLGVAAAGVELGAQLVLATAVDAVVAVEGGVAQAKFRIQVANQDEAPLQNVWVVFADGTQKQIGDVPGEGTVTSDIESRTIDLSAEIPSNTISLHVTLKYTFNGKATESEQTLTVERGEP